MLICYEHDRIVVNVVKNMFFPTEISGFNAVLRVHMIRQFGNGKGNKNDCKISIFYNLDGLLEITGPLDTCLPYRRPCL